MNDVNAVVLVGRLAADPELKEVGSTHVLRMRLAVNRDRKFGDSWEEVGHFFDCELFGRRAEALAAHLAKGSKIAVQGHLEQHRWETSEGAKRSAVVVAVENLQFADAPKQQQSRQTSMDDDLERRAERYERDVERVPGRSDVPNDLDDDSDDIPF